MHGLQTLQGMGHTSFTRPACLTVGLLLLTLPAVYGSPGQQFTHQIVLESWAPYYQPAVAVVPAGAAVQWINPTASFHSVRDNNCATNGPCLFDSGSVSPDGSFLLPGLPPGEYSYHCELHPVMRGKLVVLEPDDQTARFLEPNGHLSTPQSR